MDDLVDDQGELALILKIDKEGKPQIVGYKLLGGNEKEFDEQDRVRVIYYRVGSAKF